MDINDILKKSQANDILSHNELVHILSFPPDSMESYMVMAEASRISKGLTGGEAEVHAQFAVNLGPCPCECLFCSFARSNRIFSDETEITHKTAVDYAKMFEDNGANAIYMMSNAKFSFERFIEISVEVRRNLKPETIMLANIGDQGLENAMKLKDTGFTGVYHAVRLREGIDTGIPVDQRIRSINNFKEAGLKVGTCVEPVGPEHTNEELATMIALITTFAPSFSGAARRIPIPGTEMAKRGMISELRMAQILAATRLGTPERVPGNCTHEPCALGAVAGANLFWAEVGANPRDTEKKTEEGRGETVESCCKIFNEAGWEVIKGSSRYFR
ncbi:MAG: radical SAM protein [Desulfatiglans sp.]|jgi:biotin synthase|nr:radical SAM protein [Desulfatiglans sp.]